MHPDTPAQKQLTREESLRLLASVPIGRIIYTRRALPAVELVNFVLDQGDVIIRAERTGTLATATREAVVAFEADSLDPAHQAGWSVTVIGRSREVTDPAEISRLQKMGIRSWAAGRPEHFMRISPEILNGCQLRAHGRTDDRGARGTAGGASAGTFAEQN